MSDRHAFRAEWHDYNGGMYFVTICSHGRRHYFGEITDGEMHFSTIGKMVDGNIVEIPNHHDGVDLLNHVVMPNHIHMILGIDCPSIVGARYFAPASKEPTNSRAMGCLRSPRHGEPCADNHFNTRLGVAVGSFKAACTTGVGRMRKRNERNEGGVMPSGELWQRGFHDHIIRDQRAFKEIMDYIDANVERWDRDCYNEERKDEME